LKLFHAWFSQSQSQINSWTTISSAAMPWGCYISDHVIISSCPNFRPCFICGSSASMRVKALIIHQFFSFRQ
jgi:hypothetical protein